MNSRTLAVLVLGLLVGIFIGAGGYTFVYAKGYSYLTNDPAACANCHVMNEQFDGWIKSSHRLVATCNDCHTPEGFLPKYATKASNGFWHSYAFTTGDFHEPIQIKKHNLEIVLAACRKCHQEVVEALDGPHTANQPQTCLPCHRSVGHYMVN